MDLKINLNNYLCIKIELWLEIKTLRITKIIIYHQLLNYTLILSNVIINP